MLDRWLSKKQARHEGSKKKHLASLERRTADIRDKLSRLSLGSGFRRHSAPAQSRDSPESPDRSLHYGSRLSDEPKEKIADPVELSRLPAPILEGIMDQLSLKDLARSALLVHSSWRDLLTSNDFWKRRLSAKLVPELRLHLDRSPSCWAQRAREFFNRNLLTNPEFKSKGIASAALVGTHVAGNKVWRAHAGCWSVEKNQEMGSTASRLSQNAGTQACVRVLVLNTPTWAIPEAAQDLNLVELLEEAGFSTLAAEAYLDTCPPLIFSVWCLCGTNQPISWHRGFACVILDNGQDRGADWSGRGEGSQISRSNAAAFWFSWAPDPSFLVGSYTLPKEYIHTSRGKYKKLACEFKDYPKGVRRVQILLKGLDPKLIYANSSKDLKQEGLKPCTEFIAPSLRFKMPEA